MQNAYYEQLIQQVKKHPSTFIAHNAVVIGNVTLQENVSVWYNAVIRADHDTIFIDQNTNIQDGVIMHVDPYAPIRIGKNVVVGHAAIIHGATVGNCTLIGMRATIMNHAVIGKGCIIGAHALVTEGMHIPDYSLVLGSPAKIIKTLPPTETEAKIQLGVQAYLHEAKLYLQANI